MEGEEPAPRRSRGKLLLSGALGLALVAVLGIVVARNAEAEEAERAAALRKRLAAPFVEAANALRTAPGVTYTDYVHDVRLTRSGDYTGTALLGFYRYPVLRVDGVLYVKLDGTGANDLMPGAAFSAGDDTWAEFTPQYREERFSALSRVPESSAALAQDVLDQLADADTDFQPPADDFAGDQEPGDSWTKDRVRGVSAYRAETRSGPVLVSAEAPHQILEMPDPSMVAAGGSAPVPTTPRTNAAGVSFTRTADSPDQNTLSGQAALTGMSAEEVDRAYGEMIERAGELDEVLDPALELDLGEPEVTCTSARCTYSVSASVTRPDPARVSLTAAFVVDGRPVTGTCTTVETFAEATERELGCSADLTTPGKVSATAATAVRGIADVDPERLASTLAEHRGQIG